MIGSLYQVSSAMNGTERWQETVAQNLASSSVAGYKQVGVGFESTRVAKGANTGGDVFSQMLSYVPEPVSKPSMQDGALEETGEATDFAVQGPGFFKLKGASGNTLFTRDGQFHFDASGVLVSKNGFEVQGTSGQIVASPKGGAIYFNSQGDLEQGKQVIGRMVVYDLPDPSKLIHVQGGFSFPDGGEGNAAMVVNPKLLNGHLEASNVSPMNEMVNLIQLAHAHELNQRVISQLDTQLGQTIQILGNVRA